MGLVIVEEPRDGIAQLALNNPEKRNALSMELRAELAAVLPKLVADDAVRGIVIRGEGGVFCAGGDISTMEDYTPERGRARMRSGHPFVRMLHECEKPVVAAVEGFAVGAGAGLALLCDMIVMGEGATIGFPFFRIGLVPDWGILHTLPRRVGAGRARQLLLHARMPKGREAYDWGLADMLVPDSQVLAEAVSQARSLAAQPRNAFALVKRQLSLQPISFDDTLEWEALAQPISFKTADHQEGRAAFLEKRKPKFE